MVARKRTMAGLGPGLAVTTLRQQVEIIDSGAISLDSLWRAAGRPAGKDPRAWATLASPLVSGFADYVANLTRQKNREEEPVLWEWKAADSDPWRTGDLMTVPDIAQIYAAFLDA